MIYVTARVIHVSEVRSGGERQYLIGCRFTGRLASLAEEAAESDVQVAGA
ncbi:MAG TPA: hypothetical protein VMV10_18295 [Pirellulales bacterium]|nr:hypothetical protein [Pirellulales bacterium]